MKSYTTLLKGALVTALMGFTSLQATYTGFTLGYLIDGEEILYTAHIGVELAKSDQVYHGLEFEIGYTGDDTGWAEIDIVPLMLNYRLVNTATEGFDLYFGLGAGVSRIDVSSGYGSAEDDVLTLQGFAGGELHLTDQIGLRIGYRYMWFDDVFGVDSVDDNVIEAGLSFLF